MRGWCRGVVGVAVTWIVAACGGHSSSPADGAAGDDGPTRDGGVDAADVDAAPGPVTVTVHERFTNAPAAAMPVVFLDADSAVVAMTTTDAQGMATATMAAGGSVTAVEPTPPGFTGDRIVTFLGVKPGDHLLVGEPAPPTPTTFTATFVLPAMPSAAYFGVSTTCGGGLASTSTVEVTLSCNTLDVYAYYTDASTETIAAFYKPNVAVTAGATIDLLTEVVHGLKAVTITFDNLPAGLEEPSFVMLDPVPPGSHSAVPDALTVTSSGGALRATATFTVPDVPALDWIAGLEIHRPLPRTQLFTVRVPGATDRTIDVGPKLLPWFTQDLSFDIPGHAITWSETAGAPSSYARMTLHVVGDSTRRYTWEIAGPAQAGALVLPQFTGAFATYNLRATDGIGLDRAYLRRVPAGWDSVRPCAFDVDCFYPRLAQGDYTVASGADDVSP